MSSLKLSGIFRTANIAYSSLFIPFLMHRYFVAQILFWGFYAVILFKESFLNNMFVWLHLIGQMFTC